MRTNRIKILTITSLLFALVMGGCTEEIKMQSAHTTEQKLSFRIIGSDKALYAPKETVTISCKIENTAVPTESLTLETLLFHHEKKVSSFQTKLLSRQGEEVQVLFPAPDPDFTGYLVRIQVVDEAGEVLAKDTCAIDVSSSFVKFPRYGYVCDYGPSLPAEDMIAQMNRYHINVIEYYDWHHLHHEPLPDSVSKDHLSDWTDWSGRTIHVDTLLRYIKAAQKKKMVNMAYNMIYAGTDSFFTDKEGRETPACCWRLFFKEGNPKGKGPFYFTMGNSPSHNGHLYFVNPLNPEWQTYIFAKENRALEILGFDGWHGDTIGEFGEMTDAYGNPLGYDEDGKPIYLVKQTYRSFLNAAKKALGKKYLSFNPVGAQGNEQANTSHTDVLYAEFWPWDRARDGELFNTYHSVLREVERSKEDSKSYSMDGVGKSLTVKAYINIDTKKDFMNDAAVLLMDAITFAAGGGRLELGDGNRMLHAAYYPDDKIPMSEHLKTKITSMYDFSVAYENLLRDGQTPTDNRVEIEGVPTSSVGESYKVWTYTKEDATHQILHLINLRNNDNLWVDEQGNKKDPEVLHNLKVKFYTDKKISAAYLASPDYNGCESTPLPFETGKDPSGSYLQFTVGTLEYWGMVYLVS